MPERVFTVVPEDGLHARPASTFVETADDADAEVQVGRPDGDLVNAASLLAVTGLDITTGESVRVVADGADAEATLDELERIVTTPESDDSG